MNLIIDISNLFCKSYAIYRSFNYKAIKSKEEERAILIRKFFNDFFFSINKFNKVDKIICCFDSHSFRKKFKTSYKATRVAKSFDFYEVLDEIKYILTSKGFIIAKIEDLEADDLIYLWCEKLGMLDKTIISTDEDVRQLLNNTTMSYSNTSNINIIYYHKDSKYDLSQFKDIKLVIEDPKYVLFKKILLGDSSDNVERCIKEGIGEVKLKKIYDKFIESGLKFNIGNLLNLDVEVAEDKMIENYFLTYLSKSNYSDDIINNINLYFSQNHSFAYNLGLNTKDLLVGTKYAKIG